MLSSFPRGRRKSSKPYHGDTMMHYPAFEICTVSRNSTLDDLFGPRIPKYSEGSHSKRIFSRLLPAAALLIQYSGTNSNSGRLEPWYNETFGSL